MARKISGGLVGQPSVGAINVDPTAVLTAAENQNITLNPTGTGIFVVNSDTLLTTQHDLRFGDVDSSNWVAVRAPAVIATNYIVTLPVAAPIAARQVLASTDTAGTLAWDTPRTFTYITLSSSFSAEVFGGYFVNTSGGVITATLPASPSVGDSIRFLDVAKTFDTNAFTVARNGKLLQGDAENLVVSTESAAFELIFSGDTFGWRIFSI
jgi:hypothetical protein